MVVGDRGDDAGDLGTVVVAGECRGVVIHHVVDIVDLPPQVRVRHVRAGVHDRDVDARALRDGLRDAGVGFAETALEIDVRVVVPVRVPSAAGIDRKIPQRFGELHPLVASERREQRVPAGSGRRFQHDAIQIQALDGPAYDRAPAVIALQRGKGGHRVLAGAVVSGWRVAEQAGTRVDCRRLDRIGDG